MFIKIQSNCKEYNMKTNKKHRTKILIFSKHVVNSKMIVEKYKLGTAQCFTYL